MTLDFAALAVGDKVALVMANRFGDPWTAVRFGTVKRGLKTRAVVRFGSEDVAWVNAHQRYGRCCRMSRWDFAQDEQLVSVDEGRSVAAAISARAAVVKAVMAPTWTRLSRRGETRAPQKTCAS